MPKSRNAQTEQAIRAAALRLFLEKGYSATSYTNLANCSGVTRTLVQRYYPKKDLLAVGYVAAVCEAAVRAHPDELHERLTERVLGGRRRNIGVYFP